MDKKTTRKNQTRLQVNWPSEDQYWTVKDLLKQNPQFKEITLRVRLAKAIAEQNVAVIGDKMNSHGRPEMVCAFRQKKDKTVKESVVKAAEAAGIRISKISPVVVANINPQPATIPVISNGKDATVNLNPAAQKATVA
jgi:hypothetical protein